MSLSAGALDREKSLHVEVLGAGPPVVLLHGWAMHGGVMRGLAEEMARTHRVFLVDLPGHGRSPSWPCFDLPTVLGCLQRSVPPSAHWLGWSLGGLLALAMADSAPTKVRSLTLLSASPCFVARPGWPGIAAEDLAEMGTALLLDPTSTLRRFAGLQTFGVPEARPLAQQLLDGLSEAPWARSEALRGGLSVLAETDLRSALGRLEAPLLVILGRRDRLVPVAQGALLTTINPSACVRILDQATHVPFLTHLQPVTDLVQTFLEALDRDR